MVTAPNKVRPPKTHSVARRPTGEAPQIGAWFKKGSGTGEFFVPVGPPEARLLVSIIDPAPAGSSPAATIFVLHGAYGQSRDMEKTASLLAAGGYRAVLVDLRGHGRSTGERITYGVRESQDLSQVIDFLAARGLVSGEIGAYGFSFGAATAIQLAGRDRRVRVVVAVAPFSSLEAASGHLMRSKLPGAKYYATDQWVNRTLAEAGRQGGFDYRQANPAAALANTDARVLLIHGAADDIVKPYHSTELYRAAYGRSNVVFIEGAGHNDLAADATGVAAAKGRDWFDRWLKPAPYGIQ